MRIGKIEGGKLVQIIKTAESVMFSKDRGWICICRDFQQPKHMQTSVAWVPATTRFEWVRDFAMVD